MGEEKEWLYNLLEEIFLLLDDGDRRLYALFHIGQEPGISSSHPNERLLYDTTSPASSQSK